MNAVVAPPALQTPANLRVTNATVAAHTRAATRWWDRAEARIFLACFALNLAAAQILGYEWKIGNADAITRTANAAYVLFSRDPHAAAAGFVWPVLPSLLELPILPVLRLIGHPEAAGYVLSAAAGAGVITALFRLLGVFGMRGWTRMLWVACVQLHVHFWYLSASGVAEVPLMLVLVLLVLALMRSSSDTLRLILAGTALAAGVLIRYEALAFMAVIPVILVIEQWPLRPLRTSWAALEARAVAILAPPVYIFGLWVALNWMIMGDPLYFQRSVFSLASAPDVARNIGPSHPLWPAMGSLPSTLEYSLRRITEASLAFPVVGITCLAVGVVQRNRRLLSLTILASSIFVLTAFQVFSGTLPSLHRYWGYAVPLAVVLAGACWQAIGRRGSANRIMFEMIASTLLLGAVATSAFGLGVPDGGVDEIRLADRLLGKIQAERELRVEDSNWVRQQDAPKLAATLDFYSAQGPTIVDTETAFSGILGAVHPERLVISSDRDFAKILDAPDRYARFIVITDPALGGPRDTVNARYPTLFAQGAPWARLVEQVKGAIKPWRVYEVIGSPDATDDVPASSPIVSDSASAAGELQAQSPAGRPNQPAIVPTDSADTSDAATRDDQVLMPPPNTAVPALLARSPVVLTRDPAFGESATVLALVDPVTVIGLAPVGCWSGPNATANETANAVLFNREPAGTQFLVYMVRGARGYALNTSTSNYCWIDIDSATKAGVAAR